MVKSLLVIGALAGLGACSSCKDETRATSKSGTAEDESGGTSNGRSRSAKIELPKRDPSVRAPQPGSGESPRDVVTRREERRNEYMAKVDTDGNGEISDAEREAARQQRIAERNKEMDTDGDGQVSKEERRAAREERTQELRDRIDADGDGKVTPTELTQSAFGRLDLTNVDTDGNGDISNEELQSALRARNEKRGLFPRGRRLGGFGGSGSGG